MIGKTLDRVITSWNPGAERLYGYTAAEVTGRHIEVLIPAGDREREAAVVAAVTRGERVDQYQARRLRKDGTTVEVSLNMSPIADRTGTITGVASVARDVTEQQRAGARFRIWPQFREGICHDRRPFGALAGYRRACPVA